MNLTAIALRLLGLGRLWRDMQDGKQDATYLGVVVKLPAGVYDLEIRAVRRPDAGKDGAA